MNPVIGYFLYDVHTFFLVAFPIIYYVKPSVRLYFLIAFIPFLLLHLYGFGCPFTRLERYFHKENITVIDPILNIIGVYPSYDNRKNFQAWFSSILVAWMLFLLYSK